MTKSGKKRTHLSQALYSLDRADLEKQEIMKRRQKRIQRKDRTTITANLPFAEITPFSVEEVVDSVVATVVVKSSPVEGTFLSTLSAKTSFLRSLLS